MSKPKRNAWLVWCDIWEEFLQIVSAKEPQAEARAADHRLAAHTGSRCKAYPVRMKEAK